MHYPVATDGLLPQAIHAIQSAKVISRVGSFAHENNVKAA